MVTSMPNIFEIDGGKAATAPPKSRTEMRDPENLTFPQDAIKAARARGAMDGGPAPSIKDEERVHEIEAGREIITGEMEKETSARKGAIDGGGAPQYLLEALKQSSIEAASGAPLYVEPIDAGAAPASIMEAEKKKTITR
jgi:hypothetical protein